MNKLLTFIKQRYFPTFVDLASPRRSIFEFQTHSDTHRWQVFTDPHSQASFRFFESQSDRLSPYAVFEGTLSLQAANSFCILKSQSSMSFSIFRDMIDVSQFDGLSFKLFGDGCGYYVNVHVYDLVSGLHLYQTFVKTIPGVWKLYDIPFSRFEARRETLNPIPPRLSADRIATVSFAMADKSDVPFSLCIKSIRACTQLEMKKRHHGWLAK